MEPKSVRETKVRKAFAKRLKASVDRIGIEALMAWGKMIGVYASLDERPDYIDLDELERDEDAPKGRGAYFMRALCAYADARRKPIYLATIGWDGTLPSYYRRFGFVDKQRDEETGDLVMVRQPR